MTILFRGARLLGKEQEKGDDKGEREQEEGEGDEEGDGRERGEEEQEEEKKKKERAEGKEEGVSTKRNAISDPDKISETGISNILQSHRSCSLTST